METYSNLTPVEEEKLQPLKEGMFSLPNQNVIDKFSENESGELLYDGKPIKAGRSYKTFVCEQSDTFIVPLSSSEGVIVYLVNVDDDMINAEIKAVRVGFSDKTIDIQEIGDVESQVPTVNMNKIFYSNAMGGYRIFAIDCRDYNYDITNILNGIFSSIEIDYYID